MQHRDDHAVRRPSDPQGSPSRLSATVTRRIAVGLAVSAVAAYALGIVLAAGLPEYPGWYHYGWVRLSSCLVAAIAIIAGVAVHRPKAAAPWIALAVMCLGYAFRPIDDLFISHGGDWAYKGEYVLAYIVIESVAMCTALALFLHHRRTSLTRETMLDVAGVLFVFLAYELHTAIIPPWTLLSFSVPFQIGMALVVPIGRALALALLLTLILNDRIPGRSFGYLAVGLVCTILPNALGPSLPRGLDNAVLTVVFDAVPLMTLLVAAAAWHPTMRNLTAPVVSKAVGLGRSRARLILIGLVLVLPLAGMVTGQPPGIVEFIAIVALLALGSFSLTYRARLAMDSLVNAERSSRHRSVTDSLTGLLNRRGLIERATAAGVAAQGAIGVAFIDVDRFKVFNDAHGHAAGDLLLRTVAGRLATLDSELVSDEDAIGDVLVGRLGGDEFAVVFSGSPQTIHEQGLRLGRAIHRAFADTVDLGDHRVLVSASVGLAAWDADQEPFSELLRRADIAQYEAKSAGGGISTWFSVRMEQRALRTAHVLDALLPGRGSLEIHFQAQTELTTGRVVGTEALARLRSDRLGPIAPDEFVRVAERNGRMLELGSRIIGAVVGEVTDQLDRLPVGFHVAINLSPIQLDASRDAGPIPMLLAIDPAVRRHLTLEITESALATDTGRAALQELADHGYRIALDDFGTDYSSIQYLSKLPVSVLKLDRSFVAAMEESDRDRVLLRQVIALAGALNIETVAEGVETTAQADDLVEMGCQVGQGWLFDRAQPDLARLLDPVGLHGLR